MRKFSIARAVALTLTLGLTGLAGCELFVDFDRADIDGGSLDELPDGGCFGTTCDASLPVDATMDSTMDAPAESTIPDSPNDTTVHDTGTDTSVADAADANVPDANEAGADADDGSTAADADDGSVADAGADADGD